MAVPAHTVDGPAGAPVLALGPSLGTGPALWEPLLAALTAHFRVVRWSLPGHDGGRWDGGAVSVADLGLGLVALLDRLGAATASLAGVSLGGMVSLWVAAHRPDRVERLALCCTTAHLPPAGTWHQRAADVRASGTAPLVEALLTRWFTPGFTDRRPEVAEQVAAMLAATDPGGYAACCEAIATMDQRPDLVAVRAPTLVLAGREDPVCPPETALALHTGIAGSSLVVVPGAAHLATLERPTETTAALVDHLAGPATTRGLAVRRAVLGDAHVERALASATPFTAAFQDLITRYAWGEVWARPGLDRGRRSCVTLALLVALGRHEELAMHVRAARRNGLSAGEIAEVLLHTAVYCGAPAARTAFAVAERALADDDDAGGSGGPDGDDR